MQTHKKRIELSTLLVFYFIFSCSFLFFQEPRNLPADSTVTAQLLTISGRRKESCTVISSVASHTVSYLLNPYRHRQRFIQSDKILQLLDNLLLPILSIYALLFTFWNDERKSRVVAYLKPIFSSRTLFLSLNTLRI